MNVLTLLLKPCDCPPAPALDTIPTITCRKGIGQIQRAYVVRRGQVIWDSVDPLNNIPASIGIILFTIDTVAPWNVLTAAVDDTKVILTPLVGGDSVIANGGAIEVGGGDNSTLNGEVQSNGLNPAIFTTRFDNLDKTEIAAMRKLVCEDIEIYLVNQFGELIVREENLLYTGFPVTNVTMLSKDNNGHGTRDANQWSFSLNANYDEFVTFIQPTDFNALTLLP